MSTPAWIVSGSHGWHHHVPGFENCSSHYGNRQTWHAEEEDLRDQREVNPNGRGHDDYGDSRGEQAVRADLGCNHRPNFHANHPGRGEDSKREGALLAVAWEPEPEQELRLRVQHRHDELS